MSHLDANKQLVSDFFNAIGSYNYDKLATLVTDDAQFTLPNTSCLSGTLNFKRLLEGIGGLSHLCPEGVNFVVLETTAEDDRVSARVEGRGKMADGGTYFNQYHFLIKIRDGKIYQTYEYLDSLYLERLFGPMIAAAQES